MAEVNVEIAQLTEPLNRGDSSSSEDDDEPEVREVVDAIEAGNGDLVPDRDQDEQERALEDGGEQVLDPRYHATLHMCHRDPSQMPVSYTFILYVPSNYQGRLHFKSCPQLDDVPDVHYVKRVYHKLQPIPFFPPSHVGYRMRYYRWVLFFALKGDTLLFCRLAYFVPHHKANFQLSWLRLILYQCEASWSLLLNSSVPVDTPLRSNKAPGWSVFYFVVTIRHGDMEFNKESLEGWVQGNLPMRRWEPQISSIFCSQISSNPLLCRFGLTACDAKGVCSGDGPKSALPKQP